MMNPSILFDRVFTPSVKKLSVLFALVILLGMLIATASASAYLHVATAQNYAKTHVWNSWCGGQCRAFPSETGWYDRINDSYVRVEVTAYRYGSGQCYRVFAVRGSDSAPYITSDGSAPYYTCY